MTSQERTARIRAYRQGLGDCFLITFSRGDEARHMLIDCGVFQGTQDQEKRMQAVVRNIGEVTNQNIDVLVVTHEHWDHLSGFEQAKAEFAEIRFDTLWLAWTEDPDDDTAKKLREDQTALREKLSSALSSWERHKGDTDSRFAQFKSVLGFFGDTGINDAPGATAIAGTTEILQTLRHHNAALNINYCHPNDCKRIDGLDDVRIFVLGPPHDLKFLEHAEPRSGEASLEFQSFDLEDSFFAGFSAPSEQNDPATEEHSRPFDLNRGISIKDAEEESFFREHYFNVGDSWRQIDCEWMTYIGELALKLDNHTNNTSLVLAIEFERTGKVLLFPGDAQTGSWQSWKDFQSEVNAANGTSMIKAADLLRRTVFYKVSHHGSHNGTPKEGGLDLMVHPELVAVIPVDRNHPNLTKKQHPWLMPFEPLYESLKERTKGRVIRTDDGVPPDASSGIEKVSFDNNDLYIDITLKE